MSQNNNGQNTTKHAQSVPTAGFKRSLNNRHIQLIALGGTVGTGLFLSSAGVVELAGPSMLVGYALCGLFIFTIMRFLGEMVVAEPVSGSYSYFANKYWGRFPGFLAGWSCVAMYVLLGMLELTAAGKFIQYWWPEIPTWVSAAVFFVLLNALNLASVRIYGEAEFWFALIKVVAIIGMIVLGAYLWLTGAAGPQASITNLWSGQGFWAHGLMGLVMAMPVVAFSMAGPEMLAFTVAEVQEPARIIPKAVNQVIVRILIFFMGSMTLMLILTPQQELVATLSESGDIYARSPFVEIFSKVGVEGAASLLNFVILTAVLSLYNSMIYATSRLLHGMAAQGDAPRFLAALNPRGVPVTAILWLSALIGTVIVLNYVMPNGLLEMLIYLIVAALLITWSIIIVTHWKFRQHHTANNSAGSLLFKAPLAPLSNVLGMAYILFVVVVMCATPNSRASALMIPVWLLVVWALFAGLQRKAARG